MAGYNLMLQTAPNTPQPLIVHLSVFRSTRRFQGFQAGHRDRTLRGSSGALEGLFPVIQN